MKYPSIRFLVIILISGISSLLLFSILFTKNQNQYLSIEESVTKMSQSFLYVKALFKFTDDWNLIGLTFLISLFIILIAINDVILRKIFSQNLRLKSSEFWKGGSIWLVRLLLNFSIFFGQILIICYLINLAISTPAIYNMSAIPENKYTVLLLGTSKRIKGKELINRYYQERINTTLQLYKTGKIKEIIISGDHSSITYNEPLDMKKDLIKGGVPAGIIKMDGKGYRTFDSIFRLKSQGWVNNILIVSQYFHLERALYLARGEGISAIGVPADGSMTFGMFKREMFAKTRVLLDIYVFNTQSQGIPVHPRREIKLNNPADIILQLFVLSILFLSGRLIRLILVL